MIKINYKERKLLEDSVEKDVSFMVEETSLNIQQDVIATKRELKTKELELENIKSSYPLELEKYLKVKSEILSLKAALDEIAALQTELALK